MWALFLSPISSSEVILILLQYCQYYLAHLKLAEYQSSILAEWRTPPRSPDLNLIENLFNTISEQLMEQEVNKQIDRESYEEFSERGKSSC